MSDPIRIVGLTTVPEIKQGDDLGGIIAECVAREGHDLTAQPVVVVAQKIVSLAEGAVVDLRTIRPTDFAIENARKLRKDPRLVELILQNAKRVVRMERNVLIVETHQGQVCANAGIDQSNVPGDEMVSVLPARPDASAAALHKRLGCPVIISDTFGRPWRLGLVNVAIGVAGLRPLLDYRGRLDRHGRRLESTIIAVADELAAAAGLQMDKAAGSPVVLIYGGPAERGDGAGKYLLRSGDEDLFR